MGDEMAAGIVGALVGTFGGAVVTAWATRSTGQLSATLDLMREWHSTEMRKFRASAEQAFETNPGLGLVDVWSKCDADTKHALSMVVHFWETIQILLANGHLNRKLAKSSFGGLAQFWIPRIVGSTDLKTYRGEWQHLLKRISEVPKSL